MKHGFRQRLRPNDNKLSRADKTLVEGRLAAHHKDPSSSVSLEKMKSRLRSQFKKSTTPLG